MTGEFYWNTDKTMMLLENLESNAILRFDELKQSFLIKMDRKIANDYPEQYEELKENFPEEEMHYARTYQFCACNFSERDGQADIDEDFNFILEKVSCPIRHFCRKTTCSARISSKLTSRELDIIRLFVKNDEDQIAEKLFISKATAHNHITRIYQKLGLSGPTAAKGLVAYAYKQKIL